ncbi:TetR/AcrR family transcriptional regulator C-terminal ligand-binding domain-containing protein [Spiractinospora alimapuensis]|nr:TetR/AcrR family transcriptional regulator C-terminal ligand-binding domain-containing protein [Spiractinospora alimapuensis]
MTMEGVARRASTAKTSLYRRWPTVHDILLDALHDTFPAERVDPEAADLRGDLVRALGQLSDWMQTPMGMVSGRIMVTSDQYPELAEAMHRRVFEPRGGTVTLTVLRHYASHGRVDAHRITPVVTDVGEALVIKMVLDRQRALNDDELAAIVDQVILPAVTWSPPDT